MKNALINNEDTFVNNYIRSNDRNITLRTSDKMIVGIIITKDMV